VPPNVVVTETKYVVPTVTAGATAVMAVVELTTTLVAAKLTGGLIAVPPDSSTKLTVVAPLTNPDPVIATAVPPAAEPALGVMPVTVGTAQT
jgi:hypothetical protein